MAKKNSQKKIYVWAFFQQNLGDDLFVQTLVRRFPDHLFEIAAKPDHVRFLSGESNVRIMPPAQFLLRRLCGKISPGLVKNERKNRMRRADAVVKIGGSVFMEYPGWQNVPVAIPNPHYFILGANFGPFFSKEFFTKKKKNIMRSEDCCFRDLYSYQLFRDVPQVRYAPDILWAYPAFPPVKNGKNVGICILNLSAFRGLEHRTEDYERGIARICDRHCGLGKEVVLFGFCRTDRDDEAIKRILSYCRTPEKIRTRVYDGDIGSFLDAFNSVETVYASRFHAMILGFAMRKKVVPIIYSDKQVNALEDIGYKGAYWNIMDNEPLSEEVICGEAESLPVPVIKEYEMSAKDQFSGLDRFLC